jgi:hypothetical protein
MAEKPHLDVVTAAHPEEASLHSWAMEEDRLSVLRRTQMLDRPHEAQFDRWTARLREDTGAATHYETLCATARL